MRLLACMHGKKEMHKSMLKVVDRSVTDLARWVIHLNHNLSSQSLIKCGSYKVWLRKFEAKFW
jgi:hypothetical protein